MEEVIVYCLREGCRFTAVYQEGKKAEELDWTSDIGRWARAFGGRSPARFGPFCPEHAKEVKKSA